MEMHQLRYATAAAEERNFTRAARRCRVSQPSLSVQIAKLEDEIGGPLFDRAGRAVRLTPLGETFLPHAKAILHRVEVARAAAAEGLRSDAGVVRLGVIPTVAPFWLPKVLPRVRRALPRVEVVVTEGTAEDLAPKLLAGDLDCAVGSLPPCADGLEAVPLLEEEFVLAVRAGHALARRRRVSIGEILHEPWILLMEMHCARQQVVGFCEARRQHVDTILETSQVESLLGLVAAGLGLSLVPRMAVRPRPGVRFVPLRPPRPTRTIGIVRHRDQFLPPVVGRFIETVREA